MERGALGVTHGGIEPGAGARMVARNARRGARWASGEEAERPAPSRTCVRRRGAAANGDEANGPAPPPPPWWGGWDSLSPLPAALREEWVGFDGATEGNARPPGPGEAQPTPAWGRCTAGRRAGIAFTESSALRAAARDPTQGRQPRRGRGIGIMSPHSRASFPSQGLRIISPGSNARPASISGNRCPVPGFSVRRIHRRALRALRRQDAGGWGYGSAWERFRGGPVFHRRVDSANFL
jgi:hypothetical protein